MTRRSQRSAAGVLVWLGLAGAPAAAQDMEPRAYSPSPVGANFLVTSYSWSTGNVVFDPTLPSEPKTRSPFVVFFLAKIGQASAGSVRRRRHLSRAGVPSQKMRESKKETPISSGHRDRR